MNVLIALVVFVVSLLQIILFFKLWSMTNDVREIKNSLIKTSIKNCVTANENIKNCATANENINGWATNISEIEKMEAMPLISKLKPDQVIAKVASKKDMEIWSTKFWESEQNNPNYKLIYKN